jgi:ribosomal 30S subunit maturation factor RimM
MYTLKGEVKVISETRQVSEKFKLREFVITTEGDYPQVIQFQASQDKGDLLDSFNPGDQVEVSFNLRGREWTNPQGEVKVFNTLDAWKIDLLSAPNTTSNDPAF